MAWVLFVDESGQDRGASPYEVLAGIAVEDSRVWPLITAIQSAEALFFGRRALGPDGELKARQLLKRKTFRLADQMAAIPSEERARAAAACLQKGTRHEKPTRWELTALGQAKIAFCERVLELCSQYQARAFASIVTREAARPAKNFLRKDYAYLFERFFYFLQEQAPFHQGLVVFDELERSASHVLVNQMTEYFRETARGRMRSSRVIPEPMFVHSDLTTLVRVADLVAYVTSWGVRLPKMTQPARPELEELASRVLHLRHRATREADGRSFPVWSFTVIDDLRPRDQREVDGDA